MLGGLPSLRSFPQPEPGMGCTSGQRGHFSVSLPSHCCQAPSAASALAGSGGGPILSPPLKPHSSPCFGNRRSSGPASHLRVLPAPEPSPHFEEAPHQPPLSQRETGAVRKVLCLEWVQEMPRASLWAGGAWSASLCLLGCHLLACATLSGHVFVGDCCMQNLPPKTQQLKSCLGKSLVAGSGPVQKAHWRTQPNGVPHV